MNLNWIKNIGLIIVSILVGLIIMEIILRYFMYDTLKEKYSRQFFFSSKYFKTLSDGTVTLEPNKKIRSIAIYGDIIEYDKMYKTNNFGFRSDLDYKNENKRGILFLGDSFTASDGSNFNWVSNLNRKYNNINIYNFGVSGTGQVNFYKTLEHFYNKLNFDTIVIFSLTDDLFRKQFYTIVKDKYIYMCKDESKNKCLKKHYVATIIDKNIDAKSLTNKIKEQFSIKDYIKSFSITRAILYLRDSYNYSKYEQKILSSKKVNVKYIKEIAELAKDLNKKVYFFHMPEKGEVLDKQYRINIKNDIEEIGIKYIPLLTNCHLDKSMFYKNDGHPNEKGYNEIQKCVEKILLKERLIR